MLGSSGSAAENEGAGDAAETLPSLLCCCVAPAADVKSELIPLPLESLVTAAAVVLDLVSPKTLAITPPMPVVLDVAAGASEVEAGPDVSCALLCTELCSGETLVSC